MNESHKSEAELLLTLTQTYHERDTALERLEHAHDRCAAGELAIAEMTKQLLQLRTKLDATETLLTQFAHYDLIRTVNEQPNERPYPEGIIWDEAWRQRQRADAASVAVNKAIRILLDHFNNFKP